MAYNLSTLITRVQQKLDNTAFDSTILTQFINDGVRDIVIQAKPQYYQAETTYTTSIGLNTLTTSATDVLVPINMRLFTPINYAMVLPFVEYQDVDLVYPNVGLIGVGPPVAWSTFTLIPFLVNNSDAIYILKSKYLQIPAELSAGTDVPALPVTFSEIIVLAAYRRALEHDDDFDEAQVIQLQVDSKLLDMATLAKPQIGVPHIMRQPNRRRRLGAR